MTPLKRWMDENDVTTKQLADMIGISQPQAWRISCGASGTRKPIAERLAAITGIPWHTFIYAGSGG